MCLMTMDNGLVHQKNKKTYYTNLLCGVLNETMQLHDNVSYVESVPKGYLEDGDTLDIVAS